MSVDLENENGNVMQMDFIHILYQYRQPNVILSRFHTVGRTGLVW
jgi:hypothetical protein